MNISGVILFGDSVFFGYGASARELGCGRLLKKKYSAAPILIKAKNNDSTRDALGRIERDVLSKEGYSHVFLLFGNNDSRLIGVNTPMTTLHEYENNLSEIAYLVKKSGKTPVICNLQPIDDELFYQTLPDIRKFVKFSFTPHEWHKQYSDIAIRVADKLNIFSVDIEKSLMALGKEAIYSDGLHPSDKGHSEIASCLYKKLIRLEKE